MAGCGDRLGVEAVLRGDLAGMTDPLRISATYRLRVPAGDGNHRAQQLALEQSIEMLATSVTDSRVLDTMVARVDEVVADSDGTCTARLALSAETVGDDAGQLMNMLFGNSSLQPDVELIDVEVPAALARVWGGPNQGITGMRQHTGAFGRPLTCTALKPIGSTLEAMAQMCGVFTESGIDVIKDDHGWANQRSAPFAERVRACQQAVAAGNAARNRGRSLYAPSLYGHYGQMRAQIRVGASRRCAPGVDRTDGVRCCHTGCAKAGIRRRDVHRPPVARRVYALRLRHCSANCFACSVLTR